MATYTGTNNNDSFPGTSGNDTFNFTTNVAGQDSADGQGGVDTLNINYSSLSSPYYFYSSSLFWFNGAFAGTIYGDPTNYVSFSNMEKLNITLTGGDDYINLSLADPLTPGTIMHFDGGAGTDVLQASFGPNDTIFTVSGTGTITSNLGTYSKFETFYIGLGSGTNMVATGSGDDTIDSNDGVDTIDGGGGIDWWAGNYSNATSNLSFTYDAATGMGSLSNGSTLSNIEGGYIYTGLGDDIITLSNNYPVTNTGGFYEVLDLGGSDTLNIDDSGRTGLYYYAQFSNNGAGGFNGNVSGADFYNIEHLNIVLSDDDNYAALDASPLALGATIDLDGGVGNDTLQANFAAFSDTIFTVASGGAINSNNGSYANFETFNLSLGNGNNIVVTQDGNDIVYGGSGTNNISTGAGGDSVTSNGGIDQIDGGADYDYWYGYYQTTGSNLSLSWDGVSGTVSNGTTFQNIEYAQFYSGSGDDSFTISNGATATNTFYISGGAGNDSLTADFSGSTGSSYYNYIYSDGAGGLYGNLHSSIGGYNSFDSMEHVDVTLDDGDNYLSVGAASLGAGATLHADGGLGNNYLQADFSALGDENFTVAPNGTITSTYGSFVHFQSFNLSLGNGNNTVLTQDGNDLVYGGSGTNAISTGAGTDTIYSYGGIDQIDAGADNDTWYGYYQTTTSNLTLNWDGASGTVSNGTTFQNIEQTYFYSGSGDDSFSVNDASGQSYGLSVDGGAGNDSLTANYAGTTGSYPYSNIYSDGSGGFYGNIYGGADHVGFSSMENVDVTLDDGDNSLYVGASSLGAGATLHADGGLGNNYLNIDFSALSNVNFSVAPHGTISSNYGSFANFQTFYISLGGGTNTVTTQDSNDTVVANYGTAGTDTISTGAGADNIYNYGDVAHVDGGADNDTWYGYYNAETINLSFDWHGTSGSLSNGSTFTNIEYANFYSGSGDDSFSITGGAVYVDGGAGNDSLTVDLSASTSGYPYSQIYSDGYGAFYSSLNSSLGQASFYSIEHADITFGSEDNNIYVDARSSLSGATLNLNGGNGDDTVTVNGNFAGYSVTLNGSGGYTITDIDATDGDYGSFTVKNFEHVQFYDQSYNIGPVNNAPVLTGAQAVLAAGVEDTAYIVTAADLLTGFTDADGDTLTVANLTANYGTVVDNLNGTFTVTPAPNFNGAMTLSYSVTDSAASVAASIGYSVGAVNDAPVLTGTQAVLVAGVEDIAYIVTAADLLTGFSDVDGDTLSVTNLTANHGSVVDNLDGTYTITPVANYNGPMTLNYSVTDGTTSVAASLGYSVGPVNNAPTLTGTQAVLAAGVEDTAYIVTAASLLTGFTDIDGDTLSVANLTANHGSVVDNLNGTYTVTPALNYNGSMTLSYSVTDGTASIPASLGYSVSAVNDTPVLTGAQAVLAAGVEDTAYVVTAASLLTGFTDVDGDTLSVTNLTANHGAVVNNLNGTYTVTPAANYNGPMTLSYTVSDGTANIAASLGYNITPTNDAPALTSAQAALAAGVEDTAYIVTAASLLTGFTDVDGDTLSVVNLTANHGSVVNNLNGTYTVTPALNYNGPMTLSYSVTDGTASVAASLGYSVGPVNNAPVLTGSQAVLAAGVEDTAYIVTAASLLTGFTDVDGDTLSVANLTANHGTVVDNLNGTYNVTPAADYNGPMTLSYSVTDGTTSVAASLGYSVSAVNDAPVLTGAQVVLAAGVEDTAYIVTAADLLTGFSDVDGDTLSVANLTANHGTVVNNLNGTYTVTPAADYNGPMTLSYSVTDGIASIPASIGYSVGAVNDVPALTGTQAVLAAGVEDTAYIVTAASLLTGFTDVDGDTLSVTNLTANNGSVVNNLNGTYTVTPALNYNGPMTLSYSVTDGTASVAASLSYNVTPQTGSVDDLLFSNPGNDILDGGAGNDTVSYLYSPRGVNVDLSVTGIQKTGGAGKDTLISIENLIGSNFADTLWGDSGDNTLDGGKGNDRLYGRAGNDHLIGGDGNDYLYGGLGADLMEGGFGNDKYYVDNLGDVVSESDPAGGTDIAYSTVDFTLGLYVENLTFIGANVVSGVGNDLDNVMIANDAGNTLDGGLGKDRLYGGAGIDHLIGGDGNDILDGKGGADLMEGGLGNDRYYVDDLNDVVLETSAAGGIDTVFSAIDFTLGAYIEKLTLTGSNDINGFGNNLNNTITGNAGNNIINGGAGANRLTGGAGADTFVFDVLEASNNKDTIKDFVSGIDHIELATSAFSALAGYGLGAMSAGELTYGTQALTANDHLIYNAANGALYYDADGVGGASQVQIASLSIFPIQTAHPALLASDIVLT